MGHRTAKCCHLCLVCFPLLFWCIIHQGQRLHGSYSVVYSLQPPAHWIYQTGITDCNKVSLQWLDAQQRGYRPLPVQHLREGQNVGVGDDDRDTAGLENITEHSLSQAGSTQNHTERRLLSKNRVQHTQEERKETLDLC